MDPTWDLGGRLWLNYSPEGNTAGTAFEFKIQATLRKQFMDTGKIKVAGTFDPGYLLISSGGTTSGIAFPVGVQVGIPIDPKVIINGSFDPDKLRPVKPAAHLPPPPPLRGGGGEPVLSNP